MRALLLATPILIIVFLLQAAMWVPGYDNQGDVAPKRLTTFIEPSIGDARLLNPILNADTSSSRIAELVFDGLLEIDEDLNLAPRLAKRWHLGERVYVLPSERASARALAASLGAKLPDLLAGTSARALSVDIAPAMDEDRSAEGAANDEAFTVAWPERVVIELDRVVPDLDRRIQNALAALPSMAERKNLLRGSPEAIGSLGDAALEDIVPAIERNPEITFWLRDDATFHDEHRFDSGDVVFTFRAIMDARNRSPRRSDFEPVKALEVIQPFKLRVIYKRLFSPAVSAWTIGILPEHMLHKIHIIRRGLSGHKPIEAMERLISFLERFPNNAQMLMEIKAPSVT